MSKCRYDLSEDCHNKECLTCVLDKIRAKIEQLPTEICTEKCIVYIGAKNFKENVLAIIGKYKAESEEQIDGNENKT